MMTRTPSIKTEFKEQTLPENIIEDMKVLLFLFPLLLSFQNSIFLLRLYFFTASRLLFFFFYKTSFVSLLAL